MFKKNQKVVCIKKTPWRYWDKGVIKTGGPGPRYNEIVTVYGQSTQNPGAIELYEYDRNKYAYEPENFEPLVSDNVLEKELSTIPESVEL